MVQPGGIKETGQHRMVETLSTKNLPLVLPSSTPPSRPTSTILRSRFLSISLWINTACSWCGTNAFTGLSGYCSGHCGCCFSVACRVCVLFPCL